MSYLRRSKRKSTPAVNENVDLRGRKLSRIDLSEENEKFLTLNEDCWFEIFNLLTLKDLCVFTKVCSELEVLAKKYVRFKHQSKQLYVNLSDSTKQTLVLPQEDCERSSIIEFFQSSISNVLFSINSEYNSRLHPNQHRIFQILERSNSEFEFEREHFQFKWLRMHARATLTDSHKNTMRNLSTIIFWNCIFARNLPQLLRQCGQLKNLIIYMDEDGRITNGSLRTKHYINDLFIRKYRMLERFQCHFGYGMFSTNEKWARFLRMNTSIKSLTCYFNNEDTKGKLEAIVEHCISLEELFLSFRGPINIQEISGNLLALSERTSLKRVELNFYSEHHTNVSIHNVDELKSLKQLSGLHFSFIPKSILNTIASLTNLKTLHLTSYNKEHFTTLDMNLLASSLVNLEVFFWELCSCYDCILYKFMDRVEPFIRLSFKLKKMYILNYIDVLGIQMLDFHHREFNELRKTLQNATKLLMLFSLVDDEMRYQHGNSFDYDALFKENDSYFYCTETDIDLELVSMQIDRVTYQYVHMEDPFIKSIWDQQYLAFISQSKK